MCVKNIYIYPLGVENSVQSEQIKIFLFQSFRNQFNLNNTFDIILFIFYGKITHFFHSQKLHMYVKYYM